MLVLRCTQRTVALDKHRLRQHLERAVQLIRQSARTPLRADHVHEVDVGVWCASDATVRRLNANYRKERHVTDVLAFGFPDPPVIEEEPGKPLMDVGTVIVAVPFVYRRFWRTESAATPAADFHRHLTGIAVHGLCHLFGYLHDTEQQQESMQRMEDEVDAQLFGTAAASTATRV